LGSVFGRSIAFGVHTYPQFREINVEPLRSAGRETAASAC
jgi:hypothetical protein